MKKYIEITKVRQLEDYFLELTFNNELNKIIDFRPIFKTKNYVILKNKNEFKKVRIDMAGGLVWDCGVDIAPDVLINF